MKTEREAKSFNFRVYAIMNFASGRLLALFERLIFVSGPFSAPLLYCRQNYNQGVQVILPVLNLNHSIFAPCFVNAF